MRSDSRPTTRRPRAGRVRRRVPGVHAGPGVLAAAPGRDEMGGAGSRWRTGRRSPPASARTIAWRLGVDSRSRSCSAARSRCPRPRSSCASSREQAEVNRTHGRLAVAILLFQDIAFVPFLAIASAHHHGGSRIRQSFLRTVLEGGVALLVVLAAGRWLHAGRCFTRSPTRVRRSCSFLPFCCVAARLRVDDRGCRPVARPGRVSRGRDAGGDGIPASGGSRDPAVPRHAARHSSSSRSACCSTPACSRASSLLVTGLVIALIVGKTLIVTLLAQRFAGDLFKSLRTGIVVSIGGEFGFALLTILLRDQLVDPDCRAAAAGRDRAEHGRRARFLIRHNKQIARWLLRESGPAPTALAREVGEHPRRGRPRARIASADSDASVRTSRACWKQLGFEYIALDNDPERVRAARQAGDPIIYGDAGQAEVLESVGLDRVSVVVISFADPVLALRIVGAVRQQRPERSDPGAHSGRHPPRGTAEGRRLIGRPGDLRGCADAGVARAAAAAGARVARDEDHRRHPRQPLQHAADAVPARGQRSWSG